MTRSLRKKLVPAGAATVVAATAAVAYALWGASGSGSGYSKALSAQALTTVDISATTTATLYPGATGDLVIKISNPNDYPVQVTGVSGNGAVTVDGAHATCTNAGIVFTDQTGLAIEIAAGGSTEVTLAASVSMAAAAGDPCQGAVFTVPVAVTGSQVAA